MPLMSQDNWLVDVSQNAPVPKPAERVFCVAPSLPASTEKEPALSCPPSTAVMRVLVADDQTIAREVLCWMLKDEPEVQIVGVAGSGREAVDAIQREKPDLVLLDVEMPDLDGFGVVNQLEKARRPVVVFVTANESFALRAFDVQATDYLVKPCTRERLRLALGRARELLKLRRNHELQQELRSGIGLGPSRKAVAPYLAVNAKNRILFLKTRDINWIECHEREVKVHFQDQSYALADGMAALWQKLPPEQFVQLNPRTIINLEQVQELRSGESSSLLVFLDGTLLDVDEAGLAALRQFC